MPMETTPDVLVVLDEHPSSRAGLRIAERYARGIVALASWDTATDHIDAEVRESVTAEPTVSEALHVAAERRTPWVAMRRDMAEPEQLLAQLLVAAAGNISADMPGFAVILADGDPAPFRRILAIVDRGTGPVSGLLAYIGVALADVAGAEVDVLVLGSGPASEAGRSPVETLAVNRERELFQRARDRAREAGLQANWIMLPTDDDPWPVIRDQLGQYDYDLVIDDLGDLALGRSGDVKRIISTTVSEGQIGEVPLRLLRDTSFPLLLVIDEIRLGMAPLSMLKLGAAAAVALGLASTAALTTNAAPAVAQSADAGPEQLATELAIALGMTEDPEAASAEARAADAARSSRGGEGSAREAAATAEQEPSEAEEEPEEAEAKSKEKKAKEPKAPKGGADPQDVAKAERAASKDKAEYQKDKKQRERAKGDLEEAEETYGEAQEEAELALEELASATQSLAEAEQTAEDMRSSASGLTGVLPNAPSDQEVAEAERLEQLARDRLDLAMEQGEVALADLQGAEEEVVEAESKLDERKEDAKATKADYEYAKEKVDVYKESLAETRQSPVSGGYRLTARFGNTGGYWSGGVHTGLDFAAPAGTDIKAAASGTVVSAGWEGSYGYKIDIDHGDGYVTTYSHLSDIDVRVGQKVQTGDHIGDMGSTGNSTGSHLHFEVIKNGKFMDPEAWLGW